MKLKMVDFWGGCLCVCIYIYMCVCVFLDIYTHIDIYTYRDISGCFCIGNGDLLPCLVSGG